LNLALIPGVKVERIFGWFLSLGFEHLAIGQLSDPIFRSKGGGLLEYSAGGHS